MLMLAYTDQIRPIGAARSVDEAQSLPASRRNLFYGVTTHRRMTAHVGNPSTIQFESLAPASTPPTRSGCHAYGELAVVRVVLSPFMGVDVTRTPSVLAHRDGVLRNVQVRYMPIKGDTRMTIALERPGASADRCHAAASSRDGKPHHPDLCRVPVWGIVGVYQGASIPRWIGGRTRAPADSPDRRRWVEINLVPT
jgi:hypothetical protein